MEIIKKIIAAIFDFLQSIVVILAVMVVIYLFIMSPQEISGSSMVPTFQNGQYILTNKIEYKLHNPQRGDVVIFKAPNNPQKDYIKRVIGLPGERVILNNNVIYIDGQPLPESYLPPGLKTAPGSFLHENEEIIVPEDKYLVLGDNRPGSSDGREFGPVHKSEFIGKAILRYWPFTEFTLIRNPFTQ